MTAQVTPHATGSPKRLQRAHDRLCTVSRTIELPSVVQMSVAG